MKKTILPVIFTALTISNTVLAADKAANETMLTIRYGDVSADIEDTDIEASGSRWDLIYESGAKGGKLLHGIGIGYVDTDATGTNLAQTFNYELESIPIYYAPRFLFGEKSLKGFARLSLGWHFSEYKRTNQLGGSITANDGGLLAGASLGGMYVIKDKYFVSLEYEVAYMANSYYRDSRQDSGMIGLGMKF